MRTFNKSYDKLVERYGSVAPPVHLQGTGFAAEPHYVDEEESDWTIKMARSHSDTEDLLRASQHPPHKGGLAGSDLERFEVWRKKIYTLLGEFPYGEEA